MTQQSYDVVAEDRRRDRRTLLVVLVVLVLLLGGVYAAGWALTSDKLPQGSRVGGVRVGGLSPSAARQKVGRESARAAARPLLVQVEDQSVRILPADVGLEVDVSGSVGQVPVGRSFDPRDMWEALVGSTEVPLLTVAVGDGLERRVATIADRVDEPVVEGDVRFEGGRASAVYPRTGHLLDRDAAVEAIQAAYPSSGEPVVLQLVDTPSRVSSTEVSRVMRELANPALSGPVTYRFGRGLVVVVRPDDFGPALSVAASDGRLRARVDGDRLWRLFAVVDRVFARAPSTRSFRVEGRVLRASQVAPFLRDEVVAGFLDAVRRPQGQRVVQLPVAVARA